MRTDLKADENVVDVETDVTEKKVLVQFKPGADYKAILNEVAESNDKLKDWELVDN